MSNFGSAFTNSFMQTFSLLDQIEQRKMARLAREEERRYRREQDKLDRERQAKMDAHNLKVGDLQLKKAEHDLEQAPIKAQQAAELHKLNMQGKQLSNRMTQQQVRFQQRFPDNIRTIGELPPGTVNRCYPRDVQRG